ncbi:MAG TPA: hypothetical protein VNM87_15015, partial [Candidatus Udaeobacter sp.]|nr:hypothetical protein [Candidatus Udaeobacter sp.]
MTDERPLAYDPALAMISRSAHCRSFIYAFLLFGVLAAPEPATPAGGSGADSTRYGSPIDLPLAMSA